MKGGTFCAEKRNYRNQFEHAEWLIDPVRHRGRSKMKLVRSESEEHDIFHYAYLRVFGPRRAAVSAGCAPRPRRSVSRKLYLVLLLHHGISTSSL